MNTTEILNSASKGVFPNDSISMAEKLLWFQAHEMYQAFSHGMMTKEQGVQRKAEILIEYNQNQTAIDNGKMAFMRMQRLFAGSERAISQFNRDKTIQNAETICKVVLGLISA